jgi:uncharacterized oligopeptide transporter (OPT) family protein
MEAFADVHGHAYDRDWAAGALAPLLANPSLGVVLVVAERTLPPKLRAWVPSASGLGIAMVIPANNSIAMFLGSAAATWLQRRRPALAEETVVPVASGFIAGESLMGIAVALLVAAGVLGR